MSDQEPGQNPPEESIWSEGAPVAAAPAASASDVVAVSAPTSSNAIVALVFASKADKEIASSSGRIGGGSLATASKILSWINIGVFAALFVLGILVLLFLTIAGVSSN
jgi:hypothetical protein